MTAEERETSDSSRPVVFVVDDDPEVAESVGRILSTSGYDTRVFFNPEAALEEAGRNPPDVLVTDRQMPQMTGFELAAAMVERHPGVVVVFMTGHETIASAQAALRFGAADYLTKPVMAMELTRAVARARKMHDDHELQSMTLERLTDELSRRNQALKGVTLGMLATLVNALEARSKFFLGHSQRVARCAADIAYALDLDVRTVVAVRTAGLVHDIGMITVPDSVIEKSGALTDAEMQMVRGHVERGVEILSPMTHLKEAIQYVAEHHERLNGSGYPHRKRGDEISLGGQIVGIAEAWTALVEKRSYRSDVSGAEALETLEAAEGEWFSARVLRALREGHVQASAVQEI